MSGFDVCRLLRKDSDTPVVMLTARDDELDRILGLELGADDYITKPFSPHELVERVHAILRRTAGPTDREPPNRIEVGSVVIDVGRRESRRRTAGTAGRSDAGGSDSAGGSELAIPLTAREFDLLVYLATNLGLALSRRQLLNGVWGEGWYGDERTVDVHIRQLRKKIGDDLGLATVWGVGYRLGSACRLLRPPRLGPLIPARGSRGARLTVAIVCVVAATLVLTSAGSYVLVHRAATSTAKQEIGQPGPSRLSAPSRAGHR